MLQSVLPQGGLTCTVGFVSREGAVSNAVTSPSLRNAGLIGALELGREASYGGGIEQ